VDTRFWLIQTFNGLSYGALLFLVGSGLSLIFGVMRIVNLAHGSYFMLGGYVALSVIWTTDSWYLAIPVAGIAIAIVGLVMTVEGIEGSFKLNQHKSDADHVAIASSLLQQDDEAARNIGKQMVALRPQLDYKQALSVSGLAYSRNSP